MSAWRAPPPEVPAGQQLPLPAVLQQPDRELLRRLHALASNPPTLATRGDASAVLDLVCAGLGAGGRGTCQQACGDAYQDGFKQTITGNGASAALNALQSQSRGCDQYTTRPDGTLMDFTEKMRDRRWSCCRLGRADARKTYEKLYNQLIRPRRKTSICAADHQDAEELGKKFCKPDLNNRTPREILSQLNRIQCDHVKKNPPAGLRVCYAMAFDQGVDACLAPLTNSSEGGRPRIGNFWRALDTLQQAYCSDRHTPGRPDPSDGQDPSVGRAPAGASEAAEAPGGRR